MSVVVVALLLFYLSDVRILVWLVGPRYVPSSLASFFCVLFIYSSFCIPYHVHSCKVLSYYLRLCGSVLFHDRVCCHHNIFDAYLAGGWVLVALVSRSRL